MVAVRAKLAAMSCWRTGVLFVAAGARLLSVVLRCPIAGAVAGITPRALPRGSPPPQSKDLLLALHVCKAEGRFPCRPHARGGGEAFPVVDLAREVLGHEDGH